MSKLVATINSNQFTIPPLQHRTKRFMALVGLLLLIACIPGLPEPALAVASDAFLEIAVFVAATLALVLGGEKLFKTSVADLLDRNPALQVPVGATLGAFPGCGGAIVAVTQFTRGNMSFGGLVATLIATSGDAMFLLLASEPASGLIVIATSVAVGIPFGYGLDFLHGKDFLRPTSRPNSKQSTKDFKSQRAQLRLVDKIWLSIMTPLAILAIPATMVDYDLTLHFGDIILYLAAAGTLLGLFMWVNDGEPGDCQDTHCQTVPVSTQVISGTNFVLAWVAFAMIGYEAIVLGFDIRIENALIASAALVPLAAILIGFIPGCGPQVIVTSLYVSGAIPFSAQMGNAIANDGDALFPALAVAPRAAAVATAYSALPAFATAYGIYFIFEAV